MWWMDGGRGWLVLVSHFSVQLQQKLINRRHYSASNVCRLLFHLKQFCAAKSTLISTTEATIRTSDSL